MATDARRSADISCIFDPPQCYGQRIVIDKLLH